VEADATQPGRRAPLPLASAALSGAKPRPPRPRAALPCACARDGGPLASHLERRGHADAAKRGCSDRHQNVAVVVHAGERAARAPTAQAAEVSGRDVGEGPEARQVWGAEQVGRGKGGGVPAPGGGAEGGRGPGRNTGLSGEPRVQPRWAWLQAGRAPKRMEGATPRPGAHAQPEGERGQHPRECEASSSTMEPYLPDRTGPPRALSSPNNAPPTSRAPTAATRS
jgi:hypothetical protein